QKVLAFLAALASPLFPAPACADDQLVGFLVLAPRALAQRRNAPRRRRVLALLLALAAAMRVVDRVHRHAAHRGALAAPPAAAGPCATVAPTRSRAGARMYAFAPSA